MSAAGRRVLGLEPLAIEAGFPAELVVVCASLPREAIADNLATGS